MNPYRWVEGRFKGQSETEHDETKDHDDENCRSVA